MSSQPECDLDAASPDHSSHASDFNDSASEIVRRLCLVPCGLGLSHGQGAPVNEDGNYLYSQIYPEYRRRPSPELNPPSQPEDSETLDLQSAKSPVTHSLVVEGSTEGAWNAVESSANTAMKLENPHVIDGDKTSEVRRPGARPSTKKQWILADNCDMAEPPVGNNTVDLDMANFGREIVGVLQAQTAVLASTWGDHAASQVEEDQGSNTECTPPLGMRETIMVNATNCFLGIRRLLDLDQPDGWSKDPKRSWQSWWFKLSTCFDGIDDTGTRSDRAGRSMRPMSLRVDSRGFVSWCLFEAAMMIIVRCDMVSREDKVDMGQYHYLHVLHRYAATCGLKD
ncbi:hypothetical protein BD769DRAFT_1394840 [Suillus cothurnatus]|nr:hypothetical protein BD769DRAFT_1394840 [Suillus cothurnatus]